MAIREIEHLNKAQESQKDRFHQIVHNAIDEERYLTEKLFNNNTDALRPAQKWADRIAAFGGSWTFIFIFLLIIFFWVSINLVFVTLRFDPYPFILMNLFLSCLAALQAPVILMSQNRKEAIDRKRSENDYMINLKAEMEIRNLHQKIDLMIDEEMKTLFESQANQLQILKEIQRKLNPTNLP